MVSGTLDQKEWVEDAALREVREETGLHGTIAYEGKSFEYYDEKIDVRFVIIPFIVDVDTPTVQLSTEHIAYAWIEPKDYVHYDCMPGTLEDFKAVNLL